ncbi:hypothetical protein M3685_14770 [Heyndrickxia oleronia]|uniref:hypothetical protein n=1 Tax=Heyndrickxia oleronia TaxID=38875 RepID=UPI001B2C4E60|nr:hypothetical protein [Heyndrickxia oleronia]MCM3455189.1 hypothetical protein [Heyndrickxia oleronia]GIN37287.1 hypothetical protein J19TS1_02360 [Heyndrickxia oleronia]
MFENKSIWSTIFSILGIMLYIISYRIFDNPTFSEKMIIAIIIFGSLVSMFLSIGYGIIGMKKKERGLFKYIGITIIFLFFVSIALSPIFMGLFGFREP